MTADPSYIAQLAGELAACDAQTPIELPPTLAAQHLADPDALIALTRQGRDAGGAQ